MRVFVFSIIYAMKSKVDYEFNRVRLFIYLFIYYYYHYCCCYYYYYY